MVRRKLASPWTDSILLYGFGLALALSLLFNGFLLREQSSRKNLVGYPFADTIHPADLLRWQQLLSDCRQANSQKDSLLMQLSHQIPSQPLAGQYSP